MLGDGWMNEFSPNQSVYDVILGHIEILPGFQLYRSSKALLVRKAQ